MGARALVRRLRRSAAEGPVAFDGVLRQVHAEVGRKYSWGEKSYCLLGTCNICGGRAVFFCSDPLLARESLNCLRCGTTSRYRSIARGILRAFEELSGVRAASITSLKDHRLNGGLAIYDTQVPFYAEACAYPIPDLLAACPNVTVQTSLFHPEEPWGAPLGSNCTNQTLERLTFPDASFDIVVTSDVLEHVRLDDLAHREIRRVLKPGGIHIFTVPNHRHVRETLKRVTIVDRKDPSRDEYPMEKEFHDDGNAPEGRALAYRVYGTELDEMLRDLGFSVDYTREDFPRWGIQGTELFYCRLR